MANESLINLATPNGERRIIVLRGLPASGKSSFAMSAVQTFPGLIARVNNDDLSTAIFGKPWTPELEGSTHILKKLREDILANLLLNSKIEIIIIDNTNLSPYAYEYIYPIAREHTLPVIVVNDFLDVSLEECIERDKRRSNPVGEEVILKLSKTIVR